MVRCTCQVWLAAPAPRPPAPVYTSSRRVCTVSCRRRLSFLSAGADARQRRRLTERRHGVRLRRGKKDGQPGAHARQSCCSRLGRAARARASIGPTAQIPLALFAAPLVVDKDTVQRAIRTLEREAGPPPPSPGCSADRTDRACGSMSVSIYVVTCVGGHGTALVAIPHPASPRVRCTLRPLRESFIAMSALQRLSRPFPPTVLLSRRRLRGSKKHYGLRKCACVRNCMFVCTFCHNTIHRERRSHLPSPPHLLRVRCPILLRKRGAEMCLWGGI